jgi:multidrug efflux pump subunit AcrB
MRQIHGAGIAGWSIRHPIGVIMLTLAVCVLGLFALGSLKIDLLPHIIYPDVRVRIIDPGVPATIMEDEVTRQLEEQLAITEDAISIQSSTREGRSAVDLSFEYGKDIDVALRDASTRLDRAKRFLPDTIDPPVIYKRDPSQLPVAEYVISSTLRDPVALRSFVDYNLSKQLLNLPGVAAAEVGGGLRREVQVIADQERLAGLGLDVLDLADLLARENQDIAAGRLLMPGSEISGRTAGRFRSVEDIAQLPLGAGNAPDGLAGVSLGEVTQVIDGAEDERLRVRMNGIPGVKLSIQKQPQANTVAVVDAVAARMDELQQQGLLPADIQVHKVGDEARFIRQSLDNAVTAALSGAVLAMLVVYLFLGSLARTLIIGSAIPIAVLVTVILMSVGGLTMNTMTLGGLALGIGMLVDSTIVMLENIYRHQRAGESPTEASSQAAAEVTSAIVASTSTNLAAVLPFLFIGGLIGLLFQELIFTISAAILAALVVAITLVPALAGRVPATQESRLRRWVNAGMARMQDGYARLLDRALKVGWLLALAFLAGLLFTAGDLLKPIKNFLPKMDDGRISVRLTADRGTGVPRMDQITRQVEAIISDQPEVDTVFTIVGGRIFGRSEYESANSASLDLQLKPFAERKISSADWIKRVRRLIDQAAIPGLKVRMGVRGIRGLRLSRGEDDIAFRISGPDLQTLDDIGEQVLARLEQQPGLNNVTHSNEEVTQELSIQVDRDRAAALGLGVADVGRALRFALAGRTVTDFIGEDRSIDVVLRLARDDIAAPGDLDRIVLFSRTTPRVPVRLGEVARIELVPAPANILRDRQQRIVEVSAGLDENTDLADALAQAQTALADLELPEGYSLYEAGNLEALKEGKALGSQLLALALFLVLVVMAVQYESLRNPLIILGGVVFAVIGVSLGLRWTDTSISMPVWLGLIMLAGIVVNNAIVLVEYIEIERARGMARRDAILSAARLRLRPILMTTLTTVMGMLPLALALGEGSEMLQPLAITIVSGLLFSTLVSLLLVPVMYQYLARR